MPAAPRPPLDRFTTKVTVTDEGCWLWTGCTGGSNAPYGYFRPGTRSTDPKVPAHRWLYEQVVGPIPEGLELDHLCRVTLCVNPDHLEPVTHAENRRRGRLVRCKRGHDLTVPANCQWDSNGYRRGCRVCKGARDRSQ